MQIAINCERHTNSLFAIYFSLFFLKEKDEYINVMYSILLFPLHIRELKLETFNLYLLYREKEENKKRIKERIIEMLLLIDRLK